jgi:solute carrier family 25 citrate transporter 1
MSPTWYVDISSHLQAPLGLTMALDTIKVRMQLSRRARAPGAKKRGFIATGTEIVKRETPLGLYKGLGAVVTGIVPKMAIRFTSFEAYKKLLANKETGNVSGQAVFLGESILPVGNLPVRR